MKRSLLTILVVALAGPYISGADNEADRRGVKEAVLDYVEALYQVQPERIERSVHPKLWKRGYWNDDGVYKLRPMTFEQLVALAGRWNKDGKNAGPTSPKEIVIYEVLDQTASAKLVAEWGIDYFHLAKVDGRWMIMNVMWQSPPPE